MEVVWSWLINRWCFMVIDERRMFGVAWWGVGVVVVRFRVSDGGWLMGVLDVFFWVEGVWL